MRTPQPQYNQKKAGYSETRTVPYTGGANFILRMIDEMGIIGIAIVAICVILALSIIGIIISAIVDRVKRSRRKKR